ncbi:MAG: lipid-A-disaccharide synthase [Thermodesulfovibrio sp.]|nr:lipid-A-disaccharide synthase [Thermodesulfovibrio sp.]
MPDTVMIVAGETSGELYGALLAASLRKKIPELQIIGIGGLRMQAAGVRLVAGIASAFGLAEALSALRELRKSFQKAVAALQEEKPSVLVLIDYPDFNLRLAAKAKQLNIKVLYYVSPQVWAWRRNRIYRIARLVDRMAVILPFEVDIYRETGLECEFVGHPVNDEIRGDGIRGMAADNSRQKQALGLDPARPLLSLLPGSRTHEIDRLLPVLAALMEVFSSEFRDFQFCIPFAPNTDLGKYEALLEPLRKRGVMINQGRSLEVMAASDCAVLASGTATLQAVLLNLPIVVIYKVSLLTQLIGRLLIHARFMTLANILADREVVREFLQGQVTLPNIMAELRKILTDSRHKAGLMDSYREIQDIFSSRHASDRVAEMVVEMAGWKNR